MSYDDPHEQERRAKLEAVHNELDAIFKKHNLSCVDVVSLLATAAVKIGLKDPVRHYGLGDQLRQMVDFGIIAGLKLMVDIKCTDTN